MKTEILKLLTENRFSVESTWGNYYSQESDCNFFSTLEDAKNAYLDYDFSPANMSGWSWSKEGNQPTIRVELRELKAIGSYEFEELSDEETEIEDIDLGDLHHTFSDRLLTKEWIYDLEKEQYLPIEFKGKDYGTYFGKKKLIPIPYEHKLKFYFTI